MPVWHEATRRWIADDRLVVLGITQEQHPDRCRLFAQWKGFDWPILHDPINVMKATAVPLVVAIDEHGITRSVRPRLTTFADDFLDVAFADDPALPAAQVLTPGRPASSGDFSTFREAAASAGSAAAWRTLGDALSLWGGAESLDQAIAAYAKAVELDPDDADSMFRMGVEFRARYETPHRQSGDFQAAVNAWGRALELDPNQYIWRRRIQQYGPRLDKPYPFYDWVEQATSEIAARGDEPVQLAVAPRGAELAAPARTFTADTGPDRSPDPDGRINRDARGLIEAEVAVVPALVAPGSTARVHVSFHPNRRLAAHWNNENEPLVFWIDAPDGWAVSDHRLTAPQPPEATSAETRRVDFELQAPAAADPLTTLSGYALYYVCEDVDGQCLYLRRDVEFDVRLAR